MSILKHRHEKEFTIIPNSVFTDSNLNLRDIGLLCVLLHLPDNWRFSIDGLVSILQNDGRDKIRAGLKNLEAAGYLCRDKSRDSAGKVTGAIWIVSDTPMSENPTLEKPTLENPPLIKKEIKKELKEQRTLSKSEKNDPPEEHADEYRDGDDKAYLLASFVENKLCERIPERKKSSKAKLKESADGFYETKLENDCDWDLLRDIVCWLQGDEFWRTRILNGYDFKRHFERLLARYRGDFQASA